MRILVVGAGATGGYFGGRLAAAGRDVTFLVRPARAAQLRASGLQIKSPHGDLALKPTVVTADQITGPYDLVILTVKGYSLAATLEDLVPAVGPETLILPFLNGLRHLDQIASRFGAAALGGVCRVSTTLDAEGRIIQLNKIHEIFFGEPGGGRSPRVEAALRALDGAGFGVRLSTDILQDMWDKWTLLASLGAANCLLGGTVGEILAVPGGADLALAILAEVTAVATAAGHRPADPVLAGIRGMLTEAGSGLTTSMYRDLEAGGPIEADPILGDLVARAQGFGVAVPLLSAAYTRLAIYQNRRAKG